MFSLAGWLFADLLLGLAIVFLAVGRVPGRLTRSIANARNTIGGAVKDSQADPFVIVRR